MTPAVIIGAIAAILLIAVIAFALYKAGFSVDKIKAKLPMFEMEASRKKAAAGSEQKSTPKTGPKIRQTAADGGAIKKSGITAPAGSAADITQSSTGQESEINDSPIKLT